MATSETSVILHAEIEVVREGKAITFPTEGYIEVRVWRDIVPAAP